MQSDVALHAHAASRAPPADRGLHEDRTVPRRRPPVQRRDRLLPRGLLQRLEGQEAAEGARQVRERLHVLGAERLVRGPRHVPGRAEGSTFAPSASNNITVRGCCVAYLEDAPERFWLKQHQTNIVEKWPFLNKKIKNSGKNQNKFDFVIVF